MSTANDNTRRIMDAEDRAEAMRDRAWRKRLNDKAAYYERRAAETDVPYGSSYYQQFARDLRALATPEV